MRIACLNCHTLYDVPDKMLGSGTRRLRCGECDYGWRFTPEGSPEAAVQATELQPQAPLNQDDPFPVPEVEEALGRRFGQPTDDEAKAEVHAALRDEALIHPHQDDMVLPPEPAGPTEADHFADLVRAARNSEMEVEPERWQKRPRAKQVRLVAPLLILLVLALILLERHAVMRAIPASARLFHALHLS